jgi:hypothetical protein
MDPQSFIRTHVDVVMRGLIVRDDTSAAVKAPKAGIKKTPKTKRAE